MKNIIYFLFLMVMMVVYSCDKPEPVDPVIPFLETDMVGTWISVNVIDFGKHLTSPTFKFDDNKVKWDIGGSLGYEDDLNCTYTYVDKSKFKINWTTNDYNYTLTDITVNKYLKTGGKNKKGQLEITLLLPWWGTYDTQSKTITLDKQ